MVCKRLTMNDSHNLLSLTDYDCQVDRLPIQPVLMSFLRQLRGLKSVLGLLTFLQLSLLTLDASIPERGPKGLIWQGELVEAADFSPTVDSMLAKYEHLVGADLQPGERGKVGIKVNARSGRGMSTSLSMLRAVIEAMEARGFQREDIWIVDYSSYDLRQALILPPLSATGDRFEGCPVLALDTGQYYDPNWFYDSPLPPAIQQEPLLLSDGRGRRTLAEGAKERKSFLPMPLMFEVDFWINLAVAVDDPALGIDGVLANATLWNVSNSQRFLVNQATASAAVAEIAAIPELEERMVLHFVSLRQYQFIGGPRFNSLYSRSEPLLWMSSDPVALDRLLFERINRARVLEGFPDISPLPKQLPFAASLGLGHFELSKIRIEKVVSDKTSKPIEETP